MAKRRSKARKPAKKSRKTMKMVAKASVKKSAKGPRRMAKAGIKLGKPSQRRARKSATMSAARHRPIMIKTIVIKKGASKSTSSANPFGFSLPEMPFGYGRDSVVSALVVMLILFAVISAGIFYPQTKAHQQSLMMTPATMQK